MSHEGECLQMSLEQAEPAEARSKVGPMFTSIND